MRRITAIALLVSLSATATAAEQQGQGYGVGMRSCAQYARDFQAGPPADVENVYYAWAEGFMSGMNLAAGSVNLTVRDLAKLDIASAKIEIRSFCDGHPLMPYYGAIVPIYTRLPLLPKISN